ncbi:hypothetical protein [Paenibacillus koleovorans]|uniref:hypothetical protein n=1 Tax=Paenibacillus koleovorans TaxID=121608 RepID=UPI000FDC680E|nr:hypothetical protein [Paenibacillus koleovorans]
MTNHSIFNSSNLPLYTYSTNTYVAPEIGNTPEGDAAKAGAFYILSSGNISVGGGSSLLLQAANAGGSGKTMYISRIVGGTTAAVVLTINSSGTITGGVTPTPFNTRFGSANTSVMTGRRNTGTLGGSPTVFWTAQLSAGLFSVEFRGGLIVPPGQTISITLGTTASSSSINLSWWEY